MSKVLWWSAYVGSRPYGYRTAIFASEAKASLLHQIIWKIRAASNGYRLFQVFGAWMYDPAHKTTHSSSHSLQPSVSYSPAMYVREKAKTASNSLKKLYLLEKKVLIFSEIVIFLKSLHFYGRFWHLRNVLKTFRNTQKRLESLAKKLHLFNARSRPQVSFYPNYTNVHPKFEWRWYKVQPNHYLAVRPPFFAKRNFWRNFQRFWKKETLNSILICITNLQVYFPSDNVWFTAFLTFFLYAVCLDIVVSVSRFSGCSLWNLKAHLFGASIMHETTFKFDCYMCFRFWDLTLPNVLSKFVKRRKR